MQVQLNFLFKRHHLQKLQKSWRKSFPKESSLKSLQLCEKSLWNYKNHQKFEFKSQVKVFCARAFLSMS